MEIRFSCGFTDPRGAVDLACDRAGYWPKVASVSDNYIRFSLPGVGTAGHDKVITALFDLDPDAVVRTARAIYENRADFEAQRKARVA